LVPDDVLLVSESGIATRADVERLASQADAFLVGSSLMAAADVGQAARALVFGRVKICGLTRAEDVRAAATSGASHAGLILVPGTPRALTAEHAAPLASLARAEGLKPIGVFRDAPVAEVLKAAEALDLAAVQLHGSESASEVAAIRDNFDGEVWTFGFEPRGGHRLLFDHGAGGTGETFDWSTVADHPDLASAFLAGGIGPDNARAAQATGAYGIDASSRLESAPGIKDPELIRALFDALRPTDRRTRP
jgi:indole-3-glycerol phosphate synthase/phosphoribosylanthranilate isomerase